MTLRPACPLFVQHLTDPVLPGLGAGPGAQRTCGLWTFRTWLCVCPGAPLTPCLLVLEPALRGTYLEYSAEGTV